MSETIMVYTSETKAIQKLRDWFGIEKLHVGTWSELEEWDVTTRKNYPVGFWLTETAPVFVDKVKRIIFAPHRAVRYYIRNRFQRQTHILPTGFKPGEYHDLRERLLHGCMESLIDFVEVEKAWMEHTWGTSTPKLPWNGRSAEAGLSYLRWEMGLDDEALSIEQQCKPQAESARETYELYHWWKFIRPNRTDAHVLCGWDKFYENLERGGRNILDDRYQMPEEDREKHSAMLKCTNETEAKYDQEDEEMLIRLMKIRLCLWT